MSSTLTLRNKKDEKEKDKKEKDEKKKKLLLEGYTTILELIIVVLGMIMIGIVSFGLVLFITLTIIICYKRYDIPVIKDFVKEFDKIHDNSRDVFLNVYSFIVSSIVIFFKYLEDNKYDIVIDKTSVILFILGIIFGIIFTRFYLKNKIFKERYNDINLEMFVLS